MASKTGKRLAHFTYIWKMNYVPRIWDTNSPDFTIQAMEMTKWRLQLGYFYTCQRRSWRILRIEENGGPDSIELEIELSLLDNNGSTLFKKSDARHFRKNESLLLLDHDELNYTLTVQCRIWKKRTEILKSELCFARTHFHAYRSSCVWAVKEFSTLRGDKKRIRILNSTEGFPQLILNLTCYETCVYIDLEIPTLSETFQLVAEIFVLDAEGIAIQFKRAIPIIYKSEKRCKLSEFEKSKLISEAITLSDDVLLLRCELVFIPPQPTYNRIEDYKFMEYSEPKTVQTENEPKAVQTESEPKAVQTESEPKAVQTDKSETYFDELNKTTACPFKEIVNKFKDDGTLSDVCLQAGTKSFPVHKLILSSRSPVFSAMFTDDMREKTSKCIGISDMDADTMHRLLLYIYEDKVQDLTWEAASNLFQAADKYELLVLKEKCSGFLKSNIFESNVCEILVLADMYHDENLRKSAQEFVMNNSEIIYSDVWKVFRDNHSKLALETTEQIIYNMKHSK